MSLRSWFTEGPKVKTRKTTEEQWLAWFARYEGERWTTVNEILWDRENDRPFVSRKHFYRMYKRYVLWREHLLNGDASREA